MDPKQSQRPRGPIKWPGSRRFAVVTPFRQLVETIWGPIRRIEHQIALKAQCLSLSR
ncbi:uncharacterized protein K452DRAFT_292757, partial [Aplosporella prunicola CBS 121167]